MPALLKNPGCENHASETERLCLLEDSPYSLFALPVTLSNVKMHTFVVALTLGVLLSGCGMSPEEASPEPMADNTEQQPESAEEVDPPRRVWPLVPP